MELEEEIALLALFHNNSKNKKIKHKLRIHPLLRSRRERDKFYTVFITLLLFHLATVPCRPRVPYNWKGFNFSNKQFTVQVIIN